MKKGKAGLLVSVTLACLSAPAWAQDQAIQPHAAGPQAGASQAADASGISDIVVTALKRDVSLQKAPVAVTAVTGDDIVKRGFTDIRDVTIAVPNARFQPENQGTQVYIRGVGTNLGTVAIDQVVSFNVNGVYIQREGTGIPLYDVERVEVLPGPQGTLYGRNAIGGTINISYKKPTDQWETSGVLEGGNYSTIHATLVQNIPLSDTLAVRAAANYEYNTGYETSGATAKNDISGRLGLLWKPDSGVSLYLWGDLLRKNGTPQNLVVKGLNSKGQFDNDAYYFNNPWHDGNVSIPGFPSAVAPTVGNLFNYTNWSAGAELNVALGDHATLTYVPGYFYLDNRYNFFLLPGLMQNQHSHFSSTTHELRLSGDFGRLKYIAGLYGYATTGSGYAVRTGAAFGCTANSTALPNQCLDSYVTGLTYKGIAAFTQVTYALSDRARLVFGARYSADARKATGASNLPGNPVYTFNHTFHNFDYKISGEYDVTPGVMAYLTYQTGYQPGTFNEFPENYKVSSSLTTPSNQVDKSRLKAISGGIKSRLFNNKLQLNLEAFYYDYANYISQTYDPGATLQATYTGPLKVKGFQTDIIWKPTRDDQFSLNIGYAPARNGVLVVPTVLQRPGSTLAQNTLTDEAPPYAADWTLSGGYFHDFQMSDGYLRASGDAYYESAFYGTPGRTNGTRQKPYAIANASLTYFAASGKWSLGAFVRNIGNIAVMGPSAGPGGVIAATFLQPPRTYGGRATFKF